MKPKLNTPIPTDLNAWLTVFPGLKAAYLQLRKDIKSGSLSKPEVYYTLAGDKNDTGHHISILAVRMAVLIWVETGQFDTTNFGGHYWSHGDRLVQYAPLQEEPIDIETVDHPTVAKEREVIKTASVIIGTNKGLPGALIYINEDNILRWETPSDENLFQKVETDAIVQ